MQAEWLREREERKALELQILQLRLAENRHLHELETLRVATAAAQTTE